MHQDKWLRANMIGSKIIKTIPYVYVALQNLQRNFTHILILSSQQFVKEVSFPWEMSKTNQFLKVTEAS